MHCANFGEQEEAGNGYGDIEEIERGLIFGQYIQFERVLSRCFLQYYRPFVKESIQHSFLLFFFF